MGPDSITEYVTHPAQAGRLARVEITGAAASDPAKKARLAARRPSSVRGLAVGGFPSPGVMSVDTLHPYRSDLASGTACATQHESFPLRHTMRFLIQDGKKTR